MDRLSTFSLQVFSPFPDKLQATAKRPMAALHRIETSTTAGGNLPKRICLKTGWRGTAGRVSIEGRPGARAA
jgi:hypothetical protein